MIYEKGKLDMKRYQITRMKNGRQQHYNIATGEWRFSQDHWDGDFELPIALALNQYERAKQSTRKSKTTTSPEIREIV